MAFLGSRPGPEGGGWWCWGSSEPRWEKVLPLGVAGLDGTVCRVNTDLHRARFQLPPDIGVLGAHPGWRPDKLYARR